MVRRDDHAALAPDVLAADPAHAEVHEAEQLDEQPTKMR